MNEEKPLTIGQYLRQERERRNISLAEVARVTRITLLSLEALERDEFQTFPAPFFARGFLRTYAAHLGLDPKDVLARFEAQAKIALPQPEKLKEVRPSQGFRPLIQYLGILVLVVLAMGIAYFYIKKSPPSPAPSAALKTPTPPVRVEPKREPPPPPITKNSAEVSEKKHVLKVMAKEITWIRLELDDQPAFDVLLKPGETVNWSARQQFKLKLGNAGGVEAFLNGTPLGPLGASGQVVQLSLPQDMKPPAEKEKKEP